MKKALIFDLDGTLWDVTKEVQYLINSKFNNVIGRNVSLDEVKSFMGKTLEEIFVLLFPKASNEEKKKYISSYVKEEVEHLNNVGGILYPNLEETLNILKKDYELYIVSNCGIGYIESFLNHHRLSYLFSDFENAENTGKSKGENIKLVIERNNIDKAYYIGDTMGDYLSTIDASIPFIYAKYGFGTVENYDYMIEQFEDLLNIAKKLK